MKIQYANDEEKKVILLKNKDKYLIEEQNLVNGNFLIFSNVPVLENEYNLILEKSDLEKVAMAEAIVDLNNEIEILKEKINKLEKEGK
ncbi:hypothetical protein FDF74_08345 [Clostridium niameyense]|uniref:Phage protein n=1 Tax=Clostridium niameyense TaxID=1622073 RepID=A0A6M0RBP9_9CLOT|nr:hypothetical protein [Clostridium niameyense]NEZ47217.1 hypothetical protein [Clostridium niameyense]